MQHCKAPVPLYEWTIYDLALTLLFANGYIFQITHRRNSPVCTSPNYGAGFIRQYGLDLNVMAVMDRKGRYPTNLWYLAGRLDWNLGDPGEVRFCPADSDKPEPSIHKFETRHSTPPTRGQGSVYPNP